MKRKFKIISTEEEMRASNEKWTKRENRIEAIFFWIQIITALCLLPVYLLSFLKLFL